jgi:hypothetical protein
MLDFLAVEALDCSNKNLLNIIAIIKVVYTAFQIAIPVLLLLFGTIDLGKAVMAGEEKEIKAATEMLLKRAIAAIAVFLLIVVVRLVTGIVGGTQWRDCWSTPWTFNPNVSVAPIVEKIDILV